MRGSGLKHDIECEQASRSILTKWKNGDWTNNFIDIDVRLNSSSNAFPSPDQCFYSSSKKLVLHLSSSQLRGKQKGYINWLGTNYCISERL